MLLKIKKVKTEEEVVELKLPAFFKNDSDTYYAITDKETLIKITGLWHGCFIATWTKIHPYHADYCHEALRCKQIKEFEFMEVWDAAVNHLTREVKEPLLTK